LYNILEAQYRQTDVDYDDDPKSCLPTTFFHPHHEIENYKDIQDNMSK